MPSPLPAEPPFTWSVSLDDNPLLAHVRWYLDSDLPTTSIVSLTIDTDDFSIYRVETVSGDMPDLTCLAMLAADVEAFVRGERVEYHAESGAIGRAA